MYESDLTKFIRQFLKSKKPVSELWVVSAKGGDARPLMAAEDVVAAAWSSNGQQIAVVRTGPRPNSLQLWIASADGSTITGRGRARRPRFQLRRPNTPAASFR